MGFVEDQRVVFSSGAVHEFAIPLASRHHSWDSANKFFAYWSNDTRRMFVCVHDAPRAKVHCAETDGIWALSLGLYSHGDEAILLQPSWISLAFGDPPELFGRRVVFEDGSLVCQAVRIPVPEEAQSRAWFFLQGVTPDLNYALIGSFGYLNIGPFYLCSLEETGRCQEVGRGFGATRQWYFFPSGFPAPF